MKQTDVKTGRQMTCCIYGRKYGHRPDCTALQPDRDLIRYRNGWPNIATDKGLYVAMDKGLYVPTHLLPGSHTTGWLSGKSCSPTNCWKDKQPDRRTTGRTNNRMIMRISLQVCVQSSQFNNIIFKF